MRIAPAIRILSNKEEKIRLVGDYVMVHICMLGALALAVLYHTVLGQDLQTAALIEHFAPYYLTFFTPVSLVFPVVFLASGYYLHTSDAKKYRPLVAARGATLAILVFLLAIFLFTRGGPVPRSVVVIFCVLVAFTVIGARVVKAVIVKYFAADARQLQPKAANERRVLVVGGAGYIGSLLVRRLLAAGWKVRVLDSLVYGDSAIRQLAGSPGYELMVGDCRNIQSVVAAAKGVEAIVHLAAIVGDPACEQDRQTALETNFAATRMLIEVAKGDGVRRLVFTSSCSVYGATDLLMDEQSSVQPISLYGETKVDSEAALLAARSENFHPTILRLATVFGNSHRPRFDLVVNLLSAKAHQEGVITVYNGTQWRPFIHVRDVARAIAAVLEANLSVVSGQIYNVGDSRQNWTLSQIAEKVREVIPNTQVTHIENSDRRNYRVSFAKIRSQLGFQCEISVEDGIRELKDAFACGLITDYRSNRYNNQKYLSEAGSPIHMCDMDANIMAAFATASNGAQVQVEVQR